MTTDIDQIYQQAFQLRCEGRYSEARVQLQKVLSAVPGHVDALHQIGLIQNFEGDFDGSLATLNNLCTLYPNNLGIRYDLAMTQMMLGMYEEACAQLRYILSVDPNHELAARQATYCSRTCCLAKRSPDSRLSWTAEVGLPRQIPAHRKHQRALAASSRLSWARQGAPEQSFEYLG